MKRAMTGKAIKPPTLRKLVFLEKLAMNPKKTVRTGSCAISG